MGRNTQPSLQNIFADTRDASPDERADRVRRFVASIEECSTGELEWEDAKERLVPLVRASTVFIGVGDDCTKRPFLTRPFLPFVIEAVGIDAENSFQYITPDLAHKWGISRLRQARRCP